MSPTGKQPAALDPLVYGALQHNGPTSGASVVVRLGPLGARVTGEADVRGAAPPVLREVAVADPDEPLPRVAFALGVELLAESRHDARLIGAPVAVAHGVGALVLPPQPIGRVEQE